MKPVVVKVATDGWVGISTYADGTKAYWNCDGNTETIYLDPNGKPIDYDDPRMDALEEARENEGDTATEIRDWMQGGENEEHDRVMEES